jgi:DNA-binding CsgD family transcriptional regulator
MSKRQEVLKLGKEGMPVSEIAKKVGIKYQMARRYLIDAGIEPVKVRQKNGEVAQELRRLMYKEGHTPYRAAKILGVPPQYAYALRKRDMKAGTKA